MSKSFKIVLAILAILIIGCGLYLVSKNKNISQVISDLKTNKSMPSGQTETLEEKKDLSKPREFVSSDFGFSLNLPVNIDISNFSEGDGQIFLISQQGKGALAQIYITEFDEPQELTPQRILKDIPDKKILNGKAVLLDGKKVMAFDSEAEGFGKTWEVWFANRGFLYQVMTKNENRDMLENILTSWKFN